MQRQYDMRRGTDNDVDVQEVRSGSAAMCCAAVAVALVVVVVVIVVVMAIVMVTGGERGWTISDQSDQSRSSR